MLDVRRPHLLSLWLIAVLGAGLIAPRAAPAFLVGIGDQKPAMFSDPRFQAAGIRHARLAVGWDVLDSPWQAAQVDAWLNAAREAHVVPLISFGHSRTARRSLPTAKRFGLEMRRFHSLYPWVRDYATWNEANHCGEPTCHRPGVVAAYFRELRRACPGCHILAAEVLDQPNMVRWVRAFRRAARTEPRYWGLHNYLDVNRLQTRRTRALLAATRGEVWLTETGGIVERRNGSRVKFEQSAAHAAQAIRFVFRRLAPLSRRIARVYFYHWNATGRTDSWDSALIDAHGQERPAYRVLRAELRARATAGKRRVRAR